jgi:probable 2-oxoglutarate dehydrogenase E1 component DHKTD1
MKQREEMIKEKAMVDWPTAECMAIGSLLQEGFNVRISGQDVGRGTFSQRHLIYVDQETGEEYSVLSNLKNRIGRIEIANSPLSELAVMGMNIIALSDSF